MEYTADVSAYQIFENSFVGYDFSLKPYLSVLIYTLSAAELIMLPRSKS